VIRAAKQFAGWWIFLLGIYLLLVGDLKGEEIAAGSLAALLAAAAVAVVRASSGCNFEFRAAWISPIWRALVDAIRGCVAMLAATCERPFRTRGKGRFDEVEFNPGNDLPVSKSRRALVIAAISLAPDSFVLDVDRPGHRLLLHRYGRVDSKPRNKDWPL
jgi:hypothetical protein